MGGQAGEEGWEGAGQQGAAPPAGQLQAKGVAFDQPPQRQPWAIEAVLHDPDGNRLVLQQA